MSLGKVLVSLATVSVLLAAGACARPYEPTTPTADGYFDAIRFRRLVEVRDHGINVYTFKAGTVMIGDRRTPYGLAYCGTPLLNGHPFEACVGFRPPSTIVIGLGGGFKQVDRELTPVDIEEIKYKP